MNDGDAAMNDGDAGTLAAIRARAEDSAKGNWVWNYTATAQADVVWLLARVGQLEAAIGAFVADADFMDAPVHYASTEAYAWAAGFDSGKRATRRAIVEQLGEELGVGK